LLKNKLWLLNQEAYCIKPSVFAVGSSPGDYKLNKEEVKSLSAVEAFIKKSEDLESTIWPKYFFHKMPLILQSENTDILINFEKNGFENFVKDFPKVKFNTLNLAIKKDRYQSIIAGRAMPVFVDKELNFFPYISVREILNKGYKELKLNIELDDEQYMITWYHEAFHVFQINNWKPFISIASDQKIYLAGLKDKAVYPLMHEEGKYLYKAVKAKSNEETIKNLKAFFEVRKKRRALLSEETIRMERICELSEGTAQYVERKAALALIKNPPKLTDDNYHNFAKGNEIFEEKLDLIQNLDYESPVMQANWVYNWGMGQAVILDKLYPDWKLEMNNQIFFLDEKIESLITSK
jgi:hypothetical protein